MLEITFATLIIVFLIALIIGLILGVSLSRPTIH